MPTLYIVRGLPGSGKSTFARELSAKTGALFVEPDMFLVEDGVYRYTEARYSNAIIEAVDCIYAASRRNADVIFADVLAPKREIQALINMLVSRGDEYKVKVFTLKITPEESKKRNVHEVGHKDIDRMAEQWEDWPGEQVINGLVRNGTEGTEVNHG